MMISSIISSAVCYVVTVNTDGNGWPALEPEAIPNDFEERIWRLDIEREALNFGRRVIAGRLLFGRFLRRNPEYG
jgi:hypothetical protein